MISMNLRTWLLFCCLVALLAGGCQSRGPRFDPRDPQSRTSQAPEDLGPFTNAVALGGQAFTIIDSTNHLDPAWLKPPADFFTLGPGDTLEIESLGEDKSRVVLVVGPDGKVYYSLLPGTFVWGLTISQTKDLLEREMARYFKTKPELEVSLKVSRSKQFWMLGSVSTPGVYPLTNAVTLLGAIAGAKGTTPAGPSSEEVADLPNSFLLREGVMMPVDFQSLIRRGDMSQNIYLQHGDFIYLKPGVSKSIYVLGAVAAPGAGVYNGMSTLASAITGAGGTIEYAYLSHVAIVRGSVSHPRIAIVDFKKIRAGKQTDIRLDPGDIIYVPFAPYRKLAMFAEQIVNQFVRTIAINEGQNAVIQGRPINVSLPLNSL